MITELVLFVLFHGTMYSNIFLIDHHALIIDNRKNKHFLAFDRLENRIRKRDYFSSSTSK